MKGEDGELEVAVPRDRNASFDPRIVRKNQRRIDGFDDKVISMYARDMSVREIRGHLRKLYGVEVSPDLISRVTDAVLEEVRTWQNRALESVYSDRHLPARAGGHADQEREEGPADLRRGQAADPEVEQGRRGLGPVLHRDSAGPRIQFLDKASGNDTAGAVNGSAMSADPDESIPFWIRNIRHILSSPTGRRDGVVPRGHFQSPDGGSDNGTVSPAQFTLYMQYRRRPSVGTISRSTCSSFPVLPSTRTVLSVKPS